MALSSYSTLPRTTSIAIAVAIATGAAGCANKHWTEGKQLVSNPAKREAAEPPPAQLTQSQVENEPTQSQFFETPTAPVRSPNRPVKVSTPVKLDDSTGKAATVVFNSMPLPQFIDSVFGVVLKRTIALDPAIQQRRDLVSMRADKPQSPSQLYESAKAVVRSYGVVIQELPGLTRFVPESGDTGSLPEIRRGRALPEVPEALRPQFYLIELENTNVTNASGFIRNAFVGKVTVQDDATRNALILSGTAANVSAAMQAVMALDQPLMRGRISARIVPTFWSAEELAKRLTDILATEGYFAGNASGSQAPIVLLPVGPINSILAFSSNQETLNHVLQWVETLDRPSEAGNSNYFIYPVRNADATTIAATLSQVLGGGSVAAAATTGAAGAPAQVARSSRVVVDKSSNNIILQASPTEYQQWYTLLRELDRPAKSALISVTIAEVSLDDDTQLGFDWIVRQLEVSNYVGQIGTLGNFASSAAGGIALTLNRGTSPAMVLNALAATTKTKVLSNPSIMTRSGENASITIGDEVPTITSSQTTGTSTTTGSTTSPTVLQTIQYRNTGTILTVRPVVRNGGRIDLDIVQEVSNVKQNAGGSTLTPSISTRKVDTKLTALDGNTIVLGGLIREDTNYTDKGVPLAKDIPILGNLFKYQGDKQVRTELIILITAYAIEDDFDAQSIADAVKRRFPWSGPLMQTREAPPAPAAPQQQAARPDRNPPKPYQPRKQEVIPTALNTPLETTPATAPADDSDTHAATTVSSASAPTATQDGAPAPTPQAKPATNSQGVVTDEALKRELMEALGIKPKKP